jgi:hypothetical protein
MTYMWGKAVGEAMCATGRKLAGGMSVGPPDPGFDREFDAKLAVQNQRGPRYGVKATAEAANRLREAVGKYPDDIALYSAADDAARLLYDQSNWIEKVAYAFARTVQEAER